MVYYWWTSPDCRDVSMQIWPIKSLYSVLLHTLTRKWNPTRTTGRVRVGVTQTFFFNRWSCTTHVYSVSVQQTRCAVRAVPFFLTYSWRQLQRACGVHKKRWSNIPICWWERCGERVDVRTQEARALRLLFSNTVEFYKTYGIFWCLILMADHMPAVNVPLSYLLGMINRPWTHITD